MKYVSILFFLCTLFFISTSFPQTTIHGIVFDEKSNPLYSVNVFVESLKIGTSTNFNGEFEISLPGTYKQVILIISYIGYHKKEVTVSLPQHEKLEIKIEQDLIKLGDVVVSESRKNSYLKNSPVKIEVIPAREIKRLFATTFTEVCEFTPGIKVQNNCGICGTTDLRIQGIEGQYTQMLINGFPIVSSLSTVSGSPLCKCLLKLSSESILCITATKNQGIL